MGDISKILGEKDTRTIHNCGLYKSSKIIYNVLAILELGKCLLEKKQIIITK